MAADKLLLGLSSNTYPKSFYKSMSSEIGNLFLRLLFCFISWSSFWSRAHILGTYMPTTQVMAAAQNAASREREEGNSRENSPGLKHLNLRLGVRHKI